ncbi:putative sortase [Weissella oryzae SG25]|uniref:Putative sortase n=1 Tax=Weissella oryzae (strain DSM 25784 / JCM 18191 / LMG 30913 / SG25) TaxID=1329250 RepID=A0A069CSF8_WEIOS|nr:class A sortase [Weissella oryzae]GAK30750.1 putative sortase [Weissella oryzae SG25]
MAIKLRSPSKKRQKRWILLFFTLVIIASSLGIGYQVFKPQIWGYLAGLRVTKNLSNTGQIHKQGRPDKSIIYGNNDLNGLNNNHAQGKLELRGYLSLPLQNGVRVSIKTMPIYEGTSENVLKNGAGTAKPNEVLGQNNLAVEAHNFADNSTFFSPLQARVSVSAKPLVYLYDGTNIYVYQLTTWDKLPLSRSDVLEDTAVSTSTPQITLSTCFEEYPDYYHAKYRVVVTGHLVNQVAFSNAQKQVQNLFRFNK